MKILCLSKQRYMSRDLVRDRFGRMRELPLGLARRGHQVTGVCLDYRGVHEQRFEDREGTSGVSWRALGVHRILAPGAASYQSQVLADLDSEPDLVVGFSDALHCVLARRVARALDKPLVIDLYDNYDAYAMTRIPRLAAAFKNVVRDADGVVCVSAPLRELVLGAWGRQGPVAVCTNAVPRGIFVPDEQPAARARLGLPIHGRLVGTAGALSTSRDIEVLFAAHRQLLKFDPTTMLVLAGPVDPGLELPHGAQVRYLGHLDSSRVPDLLNALDVVAVCNRDDLFGRSCFPQKLIEALACRRPVVVADVGGAGELLREWPGHRYRVGDPEQLAARMQHLLECPQVPSIDVPDWDDVAGQLDDFLSSILDRCQRGPSPGTAGADSSAA